MKEKTSSIIPLPSTITPDIKRLIWQFANETKKMLQDNILSRRDATGDSIMTGSANDLSSHRLERAKDLLRQSELLLKNKEYDGSINRSYFAIFHAIRALLALVGIDSRRHTGVIS